MSLMDLSSVIASLSSGTYTVTRRGPSSYDAAGLAGTASTTTFTATGSMQPASGRDVQRLPEGSRTREARIFFTATELITSTPAHEADRISADGYTWEVGTCEAWAGLGNYYRAVLLKVGRF